MIQALLNYQTTDAKLNEIEKKLIDCSERKKALSAKKYLDSVEANVNKLDARAEELAEAYKSATEEQIKLKEQETEIRESIDTLSDEKEIAFLLKKAEELIAKVKSLGVKATKIAEEIQAIMKEYSTIKATTKAAQVQYADNAKKYNELKESVKAEKEAVEKELASLKEKVDPVLMEKYLKKRANKIFPVLYSLKNNGCGACFMQLSMSEINKLKNGEVIVCDQCGRLIYQG